MLGARGDRPAYRVPDVFTVVVREKIQDRGPAALVTDLRGVATDMLLGDWHLGKIRREVELTGEVWREGCGDDPEEVRFDALQQRLRSGLRTRSCFDVTARG